MFKFYDDLYFFKLGSAKERLGDIKGAFSDSKISIALWYVDEANKKMGSKYI